MLLELHWAACLSFGLTVALILLFAPFAGYLHLVDHPGERKHHVAPTPLVGGLAMFLALSVSLMTTGLGSETLAPLLAGSTLLIAFGLIDDAKDLDYRVRLAVQATAAAILVLWGDLRIESLGNLVGLGDIELGPLAIPFTIFAVVGLINAINMLDGLDGLAGGITLAILLPVMAYAGLQGARHILVPSVLLAAGIFAFLLFNYRFPWRKRAPVFMGDAGSNFLGFVLAYIVVSLIQLPGTQLSPIAILWIVGFPVADTLTTMWRRRRKGLSPFQPDRDHVHYILQRAGFGINATVLIVSSLAALFAVLAIVASLDKVPEPLLTLGFMILLVLHSYLLNHAWRMTKRFRHLLTSMHNHDE